MNQTADQPWMLVQDNPQEMLEVRVVDGMTKQQRRNKLSQLMGDYMLQGYRMCDRLCNDCDTILLMDRSGKDYCVSCKELTPPPQKKEPAPIIAPKIQRPAAPSNVVFCEREAAVVQAGGDVHANTVQQKKSSIMKPSAQVVMAAVSQGDVMPSSSLFFDDPEMNECAQIIKEKIVALSKKLQATQSINEVLELSSSIKSCTDCLVALKHLQQ